jgi:alkylhydroperoxidase/carboxymuconolactone decarboxylase family protein YurZ
MAESLERPPSGYLHAASPDAGVAFRALRDALLAAGPLDKTTCELVVIAGLATAGYEDSFKIHSRRLLDAEVPSAALRHAVLVTLAATSTAFQVARALQWLDELDEEYRSKD